MKPIFKRSINQTKLIAACASLLLLFGCSTVRDTITKITPSAGKASVENTETTESTAPGWAQKEYRAALKDIAAEKYLDAETKLLKIASELPLLAGPHANLGIVYARTKRMDEAKASLSHAVTLNPTLAAAHNELGVLLRQQGDFVGAKNAYQQALKANPSYAPAQLNLGVLHDLYLQEPLPALEFYRQYLALNGEDEKVEKWVIDLERRLPKKQASN